MDKKMISPGQDEIVELEIGDEIVVRGSIFVLTEYHNTLARPSWIVFKHPVEFGEGE